MCTKRLTFYCIKFCEKKGGKAIQHECTTYMSNKQPLEPGQVYVSSSGSLHCKKIIHTVGPKWAKGIFK